MELEEPSVDQMTSAPGHREEKIRGSRTRRWRKRKIERKEMEGKRKKKKKNRKKKGGARSSKPSVQKGLRLFFAAISGRGIMDESRQR